MYFYHPHTGRFEQSSRSFIRHGYRDPRYKSLDDDVIYTPYRPTIHHLDTYPEEAYTHSQVNRELYLSSAAIEDSYDISNRSRNRDRDVLAAANQAILGTYTRPSVDSSLRGVSRALSKAPHRRSHSTPRSFSVPPKPSTPSTPYQSTALALPRPTTNLTALVPEKRSPFLSYAKQVLSSDNFEPMYSKPVRTPVSPTRELSPYRLRSISPYRSPSRSGTQTPVGELSSGYNRSSRKRHKPRVLATKRHVGNYYNRLLAKRSAEKTGKEGKYWPYIDVEDIENENLSDLLSDESPERAYGGSGGTSYYVTTLGADEGDYSPVTYTYGAYDDSDIPEYVPFRPKAREVSPVRDYSNVSVVPYLPKRDPSKNSVSDDIAFNAIVAASAARARRALELINWKDYDQASLVLSVEGEYHPSADSTPYEFRYISRPLALKTPASQIVSVHDSDNAFTKYMTDQKSFREGIRKRLEDGYRALSTETKTYTPAITYSSQTPSSTYRPISKPYHKRLGEKSDYKYGHSLELYPLSSSRASRGSGTLALPYYSSSSEALPESRALKLYDSKDDEDSRLSTLAKVKIKAALLGSKVDVVVPERRRRPKSAYGQASLRRVEARASQAKSDSPQPVPTGGIHAHKPVYTSPTFQTPFKQHQEHTTERPNILSWKYRIDAYTPPDDIVFMPRSLDSVRAGVLEAKNKLDRHKQLVDRYLWTPGLSADDRQAFSQCKAYLASRN